jgi:hypothetical protein
MHGQRKRTRRHKDGDRHNLNLFNSTARSPGAENGKADKKAATFNAATGSNRIKGSRTAKAHNKAESQSEELNRNNRGCMDNTTIMDTITIIKQLEQVEKAVATLGRVLLEVQHTATQTAKELERLKNQQPNQLERIASQAPSLADVLQQAESLRLIRPVPPNLEQVAKDFFNHYSSTGWLIREGLPLVNWKPRLDNWLTIEIMRQAVGNQGKATEEKGSITERKWA